MHVLGRFQMRYVSIFSGVEAATLAWEPLGWEPLAFCEIDDFPSAVLAEHWPNVPNLGDITKVDWKKEIHGAVDLAVGGSPCQSFSIAGKREGLKGASGLMFEYIRCVQELMPKWFIWENVKGALSCEGGVLSCSSCEKWMPSGTVWRGEFWTRSSSAWPKGANVSFLSDTLETHAPAKYSLSQKACAGILRRAEKRGKPLPPLLDAALRKVAERDV